MNLNTTDTNNLNINYIKKKYPLTYSILLKIPGIISVSIIIITIYGYIIFLFGKQNTYPTIFLFIAILILLYYRWWIIRSFEFIIFIFMAVFNLNKTDKINRKNLLFNENYKASRQESIYKKLISKEIKAENIIHWFIIPTCGESFEVLDNTLQAIKTTDYNIKKIAISIAGEERKIESFLEVKNQLEKKYKNIFGYINFVIHPKNIPGEFKGKGANISYCAKQEYNTILNIFNCSPDNVLVTNADSDSIIDSNYLNVLTFSYLAQKDRKYKSYQPIILFYNNFWQVPYFGKIISTMNSFWILFNSMKTFGMRNFSTHSQPLSALIETDFWSTQTIVEDGHQYWRSYFAFNGNYECIPIYTRVYQDANLNKNILLTAKSQYNQMRRWAHGVEDVPYVFCQWINNFNNINFSRTLYEFLRLFEGLVIWATLNFVLMIGLTITIIKDTQSSSILNLGGAVSIFITLSFIILLCVSGLQLLFFPWKKLNNIYEKTFKLIKFLVLYYILIGFTLFIFSGLPAIHTQLSFIFGKSFKKFNVTEKIRKK